MTNRREFLQTTAAITGALLFPTSIFATPAPNFHFIHADTQNSWPVTDPVRWSLAHAHEPILARAAEGLSKLTTSDGDRIVKLVVRRCSLNLLELHPGRVVVDHWRSNRADLKPFFKTHELARPDIMVELRDRKKETVTTLTGDSFLFGDRLASDFPLELFRERWAGRFSQEADDWQAAPQTASGFAWDGIEDGLIPWAAMKSAWRSGSGVCQNCSGETFLVNFGLRQVGVFNRSGFVDHVCGKCSRLFRDETVDVRAWMVANFDAEVWPSDELIWGRRVARTTEGHT